jgi:hypothetical protein
MTARGDTGMMNNRTVGTTIFVGHKPGTYKPYNTIGGWAVMYLDENGNSRNVDGGKVYPHRQNAYNRSKVLNESISDGTFHWFYVDLKKDGSCGAYVQAEHKQDALKQVATSYGKPKKDFRAKEVVEPDEQQGYQG